MAGVPGAGVGAGVGAGSDDYIIDYWFLILSFLCDFFLSCLEGLLSFYFDYLVYFFSSLDSVFSNYCLWVKISSKSSVSLS